MASMMIHRLSLKQMLLLTLLGVILPISGCNFPNFNPKLATRPYPFDMHTTDVVEIQVFRDGTHIEIVNSTDRSWQDVTIWVNQRFAAPLKSLDPGQRVTMDLFAFRDDIGEQFRAGGLFRTRPPAKVELIEIQEREDTPMVGMISIMTGENQ